MAAKKNLRQTIHSINKAEADWIYLIHHFHAPDKASKMEIPHHCYLFSEKGLKGKKSEQMHVKDGRVYQHVLKDKVKDAPDKVYDHLNNEFKVVVRNVSGKDYPVIDGPTSLRKIKWSAQDR